MRAVWTLVKKELRLLLRDRLAAVLLVGMPLLFILVLGLLNEMQLEFVSLETEEPNLERVFLHLTGRALRD